MNTLKQGLTGILLALFSLGIVVGGAALSLNESGGRARLRPITATPTASPGLPAPTVVSPTLPPSPTVTLPPVPTICSPPAGWLKYTVRAGDTLERLAALYQVSPEALAQANCLVTTTLLPGSLLYLPPRPTRTPIPCGPPAGWTIYVVQPGDTLYRISRAYGIKTSDLQFANCLGSSTFIRVGQKLYVPPWATRTPTYTLTLPPSITPTVLTFTATSTLTWSATFTPTPSQTNTPTSASPTPTFTPTSTASFTETPTGTFTETATSSPTATSP